MTQFINITLLSPAPLLPWIIGLAVIAWAWLLWKSIHRESRRWLGVRIVLLSVAMLSLLLVGIQPARFVETSPDMAILVTDNPTKSSLDSLQKEYPQTAIFQLGNRETANIYIPDLSYLSRNYPDIRRLFIIGNGLNHSDLKVLENYEAHLFLNPLPEGIIELTYTSQVIEGKLFRIEGLYHHHTTVSRQLVLESPAGNVDLLTMDTTGTYVFSTNLQAKETGRYLFKLRTEGSEKQILEEQLLPVEISKAQKPAILILNAAPTFETNYLKNWLAEAGYEVAVRSTVSSDKFRTEFHNRTALDLKFLSLERLQQFDLLLLSTYTLANLRSRERNLIQQAINAGLGLCLLAETPFPPDQLSQKDRQYFFDFPTLPGSKIWSVDNRFDLIKIPLAIGMNLGVTSLVEGNDREIIAASQLKGQGQVALNLVTNTYQFLLNGQKEHYQKFWTPILEQTARQFLANSQWSIPESPVLLPNAPLTLELWGPEEQPMAKVIAPDSLNVPLYFRQFPFDQERWEAGYWPEQAGWHSAQLEIGALRNWEIGEEFWFYVQQKESWESLKTARQLEENQRWVSEHSLKKELESNLIKVKKPYKLWWFFLLFLIAASLLWLEEKWP